MNQKPERIIRAGLFSGIKKRRVPRNLKRYYDKGNAMAAAIILENWERYQGLTLEWAKLYAAGHRADIEKIRKEWHELLRRDI